MKYILSFKEGLLINNINDYTIKKIVDSYIFKFGEVCDLNKLDVNRVINMPSLFYRFKII